MEAAARALSASCRRVMRTEHARGMASGKSRAKGMRLRYGGPIPGVRFGGKLSTEMRYRSESVLESVRTPKPVVNPVRKWRVLRGDLVQVTSGPLTGRRGRVLEAVRASNRVVVEGVGVVNKWVAQPDSSRKKMVRTEAPIPVSRVQVVCPETDRPTRVVMAYLEDGTKVRVAKRSGAIIPRPAILSQRRVARPAEDGPKDTAPATALERTFEDENGLYDERYGGFRALLDQTKA
jgi:large subunit ribosomal protein L24